MLITGYLTTDRGHNFQFLQCFERYKLKGERTIIGVAATWRTRQLNSRRVPQIIRKKGRISKVAVTRAASQLTFPEFSAIITGENIQRQRKMFSLVDENIRN